MDPKRSVNVLGWTLRTRRYVRRRPKDSQDVSEYWDAHKHVDGALLRVYVGKVDGQGERLRSNLEKQLRAKLRAKKLLGTVSAPSG